MRKHPFAANVSGSTTASIDRTCHVGRNRIAVVGEVGGIRRRSSRGECSRLKPCERAGHNVAGTVGPWPAAERRRPSLVVPGDDRAVFIDSNFLIDDKGEAVV